MRKTTFTLIAFAALALTSPAHAQLLGGGGNLAGGVGGSLDRTGGMVGGSLSGSGRLDGNLPVDRATGRIDQVRERAARRADAARERAEATGDAAARATTSAAAGAAARAEDTAANRPPLPTLDADGRADGNASASASRDAGVQASADGSARVQRGKGNGGAASTPATGAAMATPTGDQRQPPAAAARDRESMGGGR